MSLLRFAARTLLASYFVVNGVKAVRHPGDFIDTAQPVVDKVLPPLKSVLPDEAVSFLPADATGVARVCGALQIVGGLSLATGIGRRIGAGVLASTMLPQLLASNPFTAAADDRAKFGAELAVLGGVVVAALDTEGEPDLGWRLRARRQLMAKQSSRRKAEHTSTTRAVTADVVKRATALRKQAEGVFS
jgi:uncharacterized membrane protein YphA (DoxX/SURF4 family)